MATATLILLMLVLVALSGVVVRFVRIPLPIVQIALGVLLAWPASGLQVSLEPEVFLLVFVPPLLFIDGYQAPKREFAELKAPILGLAFGLVFLTIVVFGFALHWLLPSVPLAVAFALAAVLSPTDAVAVSSIIDKSLLPARVTHILEGEALLNDASALVVFRYAVAAALTGQFSLAATALSFVGAVLGGVACGVAVLWAVAKVLRTMARAGDVRAEVQVLILTLVPFAAYLLAEHFNASGVLAAVVAGLLISASGVIGFLSVPARMQNLILVEILSFVFNGAVFLLLGLQLPGIVRDIPLELSLRGTIWEPVLAVVLFTLILLAIRFAWVNFGSMLRGLLDRLRGRASVRLTMRMKLATALAGVRGAVTLAGVLSLPLLMPDGSPFPARALAIFIAAGVILCSLLIASLALPPVARGIVLEKEDAIAREEQLARVTAAEAAIARVTEMAERAETDGQLAEAWQTAASQMTMFYRQRLLSGESVDQTAAQANRIMMELREAALEAERTALVGLMRERRINDATMRRILTEVTMQQALMERRRG